MDKNNRLSAGESKIISQIRMIKIKYWIKKTALVQVENAVCFYPNWKLSNKIY